MKTLPLALTFAAFAVLATGCNSTSSRYAAASDDDEYVYVVDWDRVYVIERANKSSSSNVETLWVNPPRKKVKKSEVANNE